MSDPLRGLRIWISRPEPAAEESVRRWKEAGAHARAVPLISLKAISPPSERLEALRTDRRPPLVMLTSAPAAEHFARVLGRDFGRSHRWRCVAVGAKTAEKAKELGLELLWVSNRSTGRDLAEELLRRERPSRVLLPGSDLRRRDAEELLERGGWEVDVLTLYETRARCELEGAERELIEGGDVDAVAFYSPSAVRAWLGLGAVIDPVALQRPATVAVGPTTAEEIRASGLRLVAAPSDASEEALITATARWWRRAEPRR